MGSALSPSAARKQDHRHAHGENRSSGLLRQSKFGPSPRTWGELAGQLLSVTYAYGTADAGTVRYTYYDDGRQKTVRDELDNITTNFYDPAGHLTSVQDARSNVTQYGYDADNRRTSFTDAKLNPPTTYQYDARGRLQTVTYPPAPPNPATTTQYTYDGMGSVWTTTDRGEISRPRATMPWGG